MTFQELLEQLQGVGPLAIFVKLFMAAIFGGVIGLERETKRRGFQFIKYSGFYILVCHSQDILSVFFRNRAPV